MHIRTGDVSQPTLGHSQTCRKRIFAEVAEDIDMRFEVEAHESCKMYLEAAVEQEDQRMKDAEVVEQPRSVQTQDAPMTSSSSSSSSSSAASSSSSQAGDDVLIATSATASTDRDSASKRKRARAVGGSGGQRLGRTHSNSSIHFWWHTQLWKPLLGALVTNSSIRCIKLRRS